MNDIIVNAVYVSNKVLVSHPAWRWSEIETGKCCCIEPVILGGYTITKERKCSWCQIAEYLKIPFPKFITYLPDLCLWCLEYE